MRVGDGNIAGVARRNFEICVDTNGSTAIINYNASVDVVKVGADVDETIVTLRRMISEVTVVVVVVVVVLEVVAGRFRVKHSPHVCPLLRNARGYRIRQRRQQPVINGVTSLRQASARRKSQNNDRHAPS